MQTAQETTDALSSARKLRHEIDATAQRTLATPVPPQTIDALHQAGLFGVMAPQEVGGGALRLCDAIDVFEEVARADGSAGWCLMASATAAAFFGAYGGDAFAEEMFAGSFPLVAGQFAPNGIGSRVDGGYRVTGSYSFGSGIDYADWVGAGFLVPAPEGGDAPAEYRFGVLRKTDVELRGNWDVLGLQSTASLDYQIEDALVREDASFVFAAPTRRRGGPVFELGVMVLTAAGHAGFALGIARRALDELMAIAKTKVRMGATAFMKDSERFLDSLGRLESRYRASRAWVSEVFAAAEQTAIASARVNPAESVRVRQATVHATTEAVAIVHEAYLMSGTTGLRASPLQRCFRDIHAASQHFFASPASTLELGRELMAAAPDSALDA